jgi:formylglycine-generating enzyme required for sulfatase activity/tRNA A-37 threonylcarbamoyl transferase component Bud32
MPPSRPSGSDLPEHREDLDQLLERFEQAWQSGKVPRLEDFISPASRQEMLPELVKIDLDYRWRGQNSSQAGLNVEDYLKRFPELGRSRQSVLDLIRTEYWARCCWGNAPTSAEYEKRFTEYKSELPRIIARVNAELAAELSHARMSPRGSGETDHSPLVARQQGDLIDSVAGLMKALRQFQLLNPAPLNELAEQLANHFHEPRALGKELLRRGWLTPYQLNQILQGRGAELVLGQYLLLERLGEGGTGQVFKARHDKLNRIVAIKLIRKELLADPEVVGRFYREIQVLSQLDHPNVVHAYDAGPTGASHFLAMEYVEGTDLGKLVKQGGPMPVLQACAYIRQAALGLQHAHERGLVHRDIKPHNLIMSVRDGLIKVADLGLARLPRPVNDVTAAMSEARSTGTLTPQNAVLIGTADYLAPEQALDFHQADIRADIYSLGCTLYYLLTGQPPFAGTTLAQKLIHHQQHDPPGLEQFRSDLPSGLSPVLRKMLAKRPEDRYQTPAEVVAALSALLESIRPTSGGPAIKPSMGKLAKVLPSRPHILYGMALLLVLVAIGLYFMIKSPAKRVTNSIGMKLVLVPAGTFIMGSSDTETGHEPAEKEHEVSISRPFYMGTTEVTVANYRAFVRATNARSDAEKDGKGAISGYGAGLMDPKCTWRNPGWPQGDDHPVTCLSWNDAVEFCRWLSKKEGQTYRLPTEAEWEYACRAGAQTPFHYGKGLGSDQANFNGVPYGGAPAGPAFNKAVPVKSYRPNDFGLFDMHGNVWEWCGDFFDPSYYGRSPKSDPTGPEAGQERLIRGGSWGDEARGCRAAIRRGWSPSIRAVWLGFRVVMVPNR